MSKQISLRSLFLIPSIILLLFIFLFYLGAHFSFHTDKNNNTNEVATSADIILFTLKEDKIFYNNKEITMEVFEQKVQQAKRQSKAISFNHDASVTVGFGEKLKDKLITMGLTRYSGLE